METPKSKSLSLSLSPSLPLSLTHQKPSQTCISQLQMVPPKATTPSPSQQQMGYPLLSETEL